MVITLSSSKIVKFNTQVLLENVSFLFRNDAWLFIKIAHISIYKSWHNSHFYIFCLPHYRFLMIFFLQGLFMVQMCCEDILLVWKTFFCLSTFQLLENSFVRKMFDWPQSLISLVKSQYPGSESHCTIFGRSKIGN